MNQHIDLAAIENDQSVVFLLDRDYRFRHCNPAWDRFARENGGESVLSDLVLGHSIFDSLSDPLIDHYRRAFEQVLTTGTVWQQEYECSSPDVHRRFLMVVYPVDGELLITNSLLVVEPHSGEKFPAFETPYRSDRGLLLMCSNCRRARRSGAEERWDWVPGFVSSPPSAVSHGLCPSCFQYYSSRLD